VARTHHSSNSWNLNLGSKYKYDLGLVYCNCTGTVFNIGDHKGLLEYELLLDYLRVYL
jgi:hypothetical protein